jgi:hypothetical protein
MTASERSFFGIGKQTVKGTGVAPTDFMLFTEGAIGAQSRVLPLDPEIGGGAMLRSLAKVGVTGSGAINFIPRPKTIGHLLLGALGSSVAPAASGASLTAYDHVFKLPADQFDAPYFSIQGAPGNIFVENLIDMRVASLALSWKAADYVRASAAFLGGVDPATPIDAALNPASVTVDGGPQFLAPTTSITGTSFATAKVLSGAIQMGMTIPLDEQWITGSYTPDDFAINQRSFAITLALKVEDKNLYEKCQYDPAQGGAWAAAIFKEADIAIDFKSPQYADESESIFYGLKFEANGAVDDTANVAWSVTPIALRAGRQVTLVATGMVLADASGAADGPFKATLTNLESTQY